MKLKFSKMHGAGNDFVMIDGRDLDGRGLTRPTIAALCDRRTGVGADGLIIVAETDNAAADFRMIYFNSDGGEAEMCGNGARCSVAFAQAAGLIEDQCRFETLAGLLQGRVLPDGQIMVGLPPWRDLVLDVDLGPQEFPAHHTCNTGVPHLVIPVPDVQGLDVEKWGRHYRELPFFAPAGTNVNFVSREPGGDRFLLRTYERGVEAETLACGTGASATAVVMCRLGLGRTPVSLVTRGGVVLKVSVGEADEKLLLMGPAETSFQGEVEIHG